MNKNPLATTNSYKEFLQEKELGPKVITTFVL